MRVMVRCGQTRYYVLVRGTLEERISLINDRETLQFCFDLHSDLSFLQQSMAFSVMDEMVIRIVYYFCVISSSLLLLLLLLS